MGVSLSFGIAVTSMIYLFGSTSGAHINPAVTLGFWMSGNFPLRQVGPYVLAQLTGGILASLLLFFFFTQHPNLGATVPANAERESFLLEIFLTLLLMLVIILAVKAPRNWNSKAAILIGATVMLEAYFGGPISGASMNPARSVGPALISGHLGSLWIYITAPFIGGVLGVGACRLLRKKDCCSCPDGIC